MSLKAFHVVFISASALLAFGIAASCLGAGAAGERTAAGIGAAAAGAALCGYEAWFVRKMRRLP